MLEHRHQNMWSQRRIEQFESKTQEHAFTGQPQGFTDPVVRLDFP